MTTTPTRPAPPRAAPGGGALLSRLLIRDRLNLLVMLPLAVVLLLTVPFVADRVQDARLASTTASLIGTARQVGGLVQELERERLLSVAYLAASGSHGSVLALQAQTVTEAAARLRSGATTAPLAAALRRVDGLAAVRVAVRTRRSTPNAVNTGYADVVAALIDALGLSTGAAAGTAGARQQTALDALLRADEQSASIGADLLALIATPGAEGATLTDIGAAVRLEQLETDRFAQLASPAQLALFHSAADGLAASRVDQIRIGLRNPVTLATLAAPRRGALAVTILDAVQTEAALRRLVQDKLGRDISRTAGVSAGEARLAGLGFAGLALALLIGVVLLSIAIGRSISRPLRRLTLAAAQVADLAQAELVRVTDDEGDETAPVQLAAIDVTADDEIGDLAAALNRVQATAALLLERQVASRHNINTMFGTVGRRTQNLVGRQLAMIDALERDEQSAAVLRRLYRLDHVTARLRRHADSLVVLSSGTEPELVAEPLPLADVIRAALGEIEEYQRVRLGAIEPVPVVPDATRDLKLLVAELLENATSFSPPQREVEVTAGADGAGCLLRIVDHGVGMSAERLAEENARLVRRERLDLAPTDVLGLFVVGRLCRRHGMSVLLCPTPGGGLTADVRLPATLLVGTGAPAGAPDGSAARPAWQEPHVTATAAARSATPAAPPVPAGPGSAAVPPPRTALSGDHNQRQLSLAEGPGVPVDGNGFDGNGYDGNGFEGNGYGPGGGGSAADSARRDAARWDAAGPGGDRLGADQGESGRADDHPGLTRRVRGAQLPQTGDPVRRAPATPEPAEAVRALVEEFEAGELRARTQTGGAGQAPETSRAPGRSDDYDQHAQAVRSFASEIDRELRRTLDSLAPGETGPGGPAEPAFGWLQPHEHGTGEPARHDTPAQTDTGAGAKAGAGAGAGAESGAGAGAAVKAGAEAGAEAAAKAGAEAGGGAGSGAGTGAEAGTLPETETGNGIGPGSGVGSGNGVGTGTREEPANRTPDPTPAATTHQSQGQRPDGSQVADAAKPAKRAGPADAAEVTHAAESAEVTDAAQSAEVTDAAKPAGPADAPSKAGAPEAAGAAGAITEPGATSGTGQPAGRAGSAAPTRHRRRGTPGAQALTRRVPGAQLPADDPVRPAARPADPGDPEAARAAVEAFEAGVRRALAETGEERDDGSDLEEGERR